MKKALTSIIAAAALVALVVPAAQASFDQYLKPKASHAKIAKVTKVVSHKVTKPRVAKPSRPLIIIGIPTPGAVTPAVADECVYSGNNCTDQQLCDIWALNCDQVDTSSSNAGS